jgi:hypothetical protein
MVFGTVLRAIGRAFGNGTTLDLGCGSFAEADMLAVNIRLIARAVDRAVDRNTVARAKEVTAVLRGESLGRLGGALFD